jgi:cytochrome c-type biogenesis protein CcmH/NrfF
MKGFNHEAYSDQQIRDFLAARLGDYVIYAGSRYFCESLF